MALTKKHLNWPLVLDNVAQGGTDVYLQVAALSLDPRLSTGLAGGSGELYNTLGFLRGGAPLGAVSTADLKTFLDNIPQTGCPIDTGTSKTGTIMYFQKALSGGTRNLAATAVHQSITMTNGLIVPRRLTLSHQGEGMADADLFLISSDGETVPFTYAETAALPSGVYPSMPSVFTLGKIMLNATELTGAIDAAIDFGVQVAVEAAESDLYPTHVYIVAIQPVITITCHHIDLTGTLTEAGGYYTAGQIILYGRKRAEGGTFVADGTAEHLKFTLGKCRVDTGAIAGDPDKKLSLRITPWHTAGVSPVTPITISTASAIT